jgi:hypothetical protein
VRFLPPALLVVVGLSQMAASRLVHLTPWKGGGFGMFSTLDHAAHRGLDIVIDAPDRSEAIVVPASLEEDAARAIACPSDWLLRRLAEKVVARERRNGRTVSRVTLAVWGTDFDRLTLAGRERTIRSFGYDARP